MKTSKIIAVAALSMMAAVGAYADQPQGTEGVLQFQGQLSRAEVRAQAAAEAHSGRIQGELSAYDLQPRTVVSAVPRSVVRTQAVQAAHAPNQNLTAGEFVNSQIPG